jgi:hypothetical protein
LSMWRTSNIWERQSQIKIWFMRKLSGQNSGNTCYHSLQNLLPSRLYKNRKIITKKDKASPVLN